MGPDESDHRGAGWSCGSGYYKANRGLLMGGELVRLDLPDSTLLGYGVCARSSSAIFTIASVGSSEVMLPGRLRFPGLDPHRRYRFAR